MLFFVSLILKWEKSGSVSDVGAFSKRKTNNNHVDCCCWRCCFNVTWGAETGWEASSRLVNVKIKSKQSRQTFTCSHYSVRLLTGRLCGEETGSSHLQPVTAHLTIPFWIPQMLRCCELTEWLMSYKNINYYVNDKLDNIFKCRFTSGHILMGCFDLICHFLHYFVSYFY